MRFATFAPVAVLGLGVLLISGMREQHAVEPRSPMNSITRTMAGIEGRDLVVPEEERKVAGMTDYMMRVFGSDSAPAFTTYVGYYDQQVQGKAIHSPKNCLPGAGWEIMESTPVPSPDGRAGATINRVILSNKGTRALVYYWYQGRGRVQSNEYRVKWDLMRDAARYGRTEEALVRIVLPVDPAQNGAITQIGRLPQDSLAIEVARVLLQEVDRALPQSAS